MDKLKYIKLELEDGTYSASIPLSVQANHVDIDSAGGVSNLTDYISKSDSHLSTIDGQINILNSKISSVGNGTPKGAYQWLSELQNANPSTGVYIITSDGHAYAWNHDTKTSIDLGLYQSSVIADDTIFTPLVDTIDNSKISYEDSYIKLLKMNEGSIAIKTISHQPYIIDVSSEAGTHIGGATCACFDLMVKIPSYDTENEYRQIALAFEIDGDFEEEPYLYTPEISNYTKLAFSHIKGSNIYFWQYNYDVATYFPKHKDKYLQLRFCWESNNATHFTFRKLYFNWSKSPLEDKDLYGNMKLDKPYYNDLGDTKLNPQDKGFINLTSDNCEFFYASSVGPAYRNIPIDINKDLYVSCDIVYEDASRPITIFINPKENGIGTTATKYRRQTSFSSNNGVIHIPSSILKSWGNYEYVDFVITSNTEEPNDKKYKAKIKSISYHQFNSNEYELQDVLNDIIKSINNIVIPEPERSRLYKKKILVMGDSMARGHTLNRDKVWDSLIAKRHNMTLENVAQNGKFITRYTYNTGDSGISSYTDPETVSNKCVPDVIDTLTNFDYDYVIIFAGTNDAGRSISIGTISDNDYTTFYGALNITINKLLEKFTKSQILFITPYATSNGTSSYDKFVKYIDAIKDVCNHHNIPVFDNANSGIDHTNQYQKAAFTLGDVHLNEAGMERISYRYESKILEL